MPRLVHTLLVSLLLSGSVAAAAPAALAIRGYDPVAYFTLGRAVPGLATHEYVWDEQVWRFASVAHRDRFAADPIRYAPQFANFCAVALARGEVQEANPEYWLISDGKLYLFGKKAGPEVFRQAGGAAPERAERHRGLLPR
jgi:hypothetical protein